MDVMTGITGLKWGKVYYDPERRYYMSKIPLDQFETFPTKNAAKSECKKRSFPLTKIERIGSRFWSCYGIIYSWPVEYFLLRWRSEQGE